MNYILILFLISSAFAGRKPSATIPHETLQRLKTLYPDQSEAFILERIQNADSAFQKWRSFPPYYYELLSRSTDILGGSFMNRKGMCAGDPHLENFGFLYLGRAFFYLNDLDDASGCSLNADALRLFIGTRLVTNLSAAEWVEQYKDGMGGIVTAYPNYLKNLEKDSLKKKTDMPKKYRKLFDTKTCNGDFADVTKAEMEMLKTYLKTENKEVKMACTRAKDSGGSAGLRRFIVFYNTASGTEAIELKPLVTPAPMAPKILSPFEREMLYKQAVAIFFGVTFNAAYFPVTLAGKSFMRRPLWGGNQGVSESGMSSTDLKEVALFEARTLGGYHRITNTTPFDVSPDAWDRIAKGIEKKWRAEFAE
jgi:hypothetical protein